MKKPLKPFIVEHKRRPRNVTAAPTSIWSEETHREIRSFFDENMVSEQGSNSTLESAEVTSYPSQAPKPTRSMGRILEPHTRAKAADALTVSETELAEHKTAIGTPVVAATEYPVPEDGEGIVAVVAVLKPVFSKLKPKAELS